MPLTDAEIAEFKTAIEGKAELPQHLKPLADLGITFRAPYQEEEFKTNYKTQVIAAHDNDAYSVVDGEVEKETGIKRNSGEKTTAYMKRAYGEDFTAKNTAMKNELADLKKNGTGKPEDLQRIQTLEDTLKGKDAEVLTAKQEADKRVVDAEFRAEQKLALTGVKANLKKIDPAYLEDVLKIRLNSFDQVFTRKLDKDGNLVFSKKVDDKEIEQLDANYKPQTLAVLYAEHFKDLLEVKPPATGANSQNPSPAPKPAANGEVDPATVVPGADVKTKVQLTDFLRASGVVAGTKAYNELFEKYGKDLPLR